MKSKMLLFLFVAVVFAGRMSAQDHLLITEFVVSPTAGEFVEIYNPTADSVDLSDYYLTDATFAGGGTYYYQIVEGGGGGGAFGDFHARFPDGAKIGPGEHQTVSFAGSMSFIAEYSVDPTYELFEDDGAPDAIPDMREATPGSIGGQGGLSGGEVIILYYWDGESDLVQDVDYVLWGDKAEAVDKTGVSIDGPDADTDPSTYLDDTPIADQMVVNADNDDDEDPHDFLSSAQRKLDVEDVEAWTDGNGITGHNETSENTSWLGGIWSYHHAATPGTRSFGKPASDSLTIADIQFLRADDVGEDANDDALSLGDTLEVSGMVMHGMRELFLGARWGGFISDGDNGPWSGFFLTQNDSSVGGTNLSAAQPGDIIRVKGIVSEFPTNANTQSISQFTIITDPVEPIEFLDFGQALPDTILLKPGDLGATGSSEDPRLTERLESTLARFEGLTVLSNFEGQPGNIMTAGDETGTIALDDYFLGLRNFLDSNQGVWPGFPAGTKINVTGYVRDVQTGGAGRTTINPVSFEAVEVASSPPEISGIARDPVTVTSQDNVVVSATIADAQTSVASAELMYRVDGGAFQMITMADQGDNLWTGTIPMQVNGAQVDYLLKATDTDAATTTAPGDTSASKFFYFVRDEGLTIFDVQFTPFDDGNSSYNNLEVTVTGIVTSDTADFSFYFIQDGIEPWSGIHIDDNVNNVKLGDEVTVTGTARERFNETQIFTVTDVTVNSSGNDVPGPVVKTTGELGTGSDVAEMYEGMLIRVEDVTVSNPFADDPSNFGEFEIDDGSGPVRVDDIGNFRGNLDSVFVQDQPLASVTGIHYYSFSNFKLIPRNNADVDTDVTSVADAGIPLTFELSQNYPNPFNPETTIRYNVADLSEVSIEIFNIMGQKVRTLVNSTQPAGVYTVQWNGTNEAGAKVATGLYIYKMKAGSFLQVKKMLMLK